MIKIIVLVVLFLGISCSSGSRVPRQTAPQNRPPTTTTGTTTTTPSPAYTRCIRNCIATAEYNPVCGTDRVTYSNIGRLNCAVNCGAGIRLASRGTC